jgi:hypothetical protein
MNGVKERYDNLYNYPVGEEPGTDYSGASDLYAGGMNKSLTAALISGGAALAGGAINYFANRENNQSNREMQEMANQHNIDLWRMQTEYNTPANQLTRLRQAGLNPNLLYGNPTNTAGSPPEIKASRNERYALDPMAMANVMLMSKQIQNLDADNEVKQAEARSINASAISQEQENEKFEEKFQLFKNKEQVSIDLMKSSQALNDKQRQQIGQTMDHFAKISDKLVQELDSKVLKNLGDYDVSKQEIENMKQDYKRIVLLCRDLSEKIKLFYETPFTLDGQTGSYSWHQHRYYLLQGQSDLGLTNKEGYAYKISNELSDLELAVRRLQQPGLTQKIKDDYSFWLNSWYREFTDELISPLTGSIGNLLGGSYTGFSLQYRPSQAGYQYSGRIKRKPIKLGF